MKSFLENPSVYLGNLSAEHKAEEARVRESMRVDLRVRQILEHDWDRADPFHSHSASDAGLGSAANDLFHPGAIGMHSARPGSRRHGDFPPYYRTEMQHWQIVDAARILEALCPTAVNVLDTLTQFAIFTGFDYKVVPKGDGLREPNTESENEGLKKSIRSKLVARKAQEFLDNWRRQVNWYSWETEIFRRVIRDGEAFVVIESDELTGMPVLRSVEPEQVKQPMNREGLNAALEIRSDSSWKYGILTSKEDTATPAGYWVVSQYSEKQNLGTFYPAEEMIHIKNEWVHRNAKRGVSDFFPVANDIPGTKKLLRNLREGATVQAAIAWIREHPEGIPVGLPAGGDPTNVTRTGQRTTSVTYDGPTMLDVMQGMKYTAGPISASGKSDVLVKVLQAGLRGIGIRWQFPEGMISGDASNANMASALVAEGPFVRAMTFRQWWYRCAYKSVALRILDRAAVTGKIGPARENILDEIDVTVEMKAVLARDPKEETDRNAVLDKAGVISMKSWTAREDLDFEVEQQNIAEQPDREPAEDTQTGTPGKTDSDISIQQGERAVR